MPFELHRETKRGNLERVRQLLHSGADVNAKDRQDRTPLTHALKSPAASVELVRLLLDSGGIVSETARFDGENTSLAAVCLRGGDPPKLALVLERGADVHYQSSHGYDALMDAIYRVGIESDPGLLNLLQILIDCGVPLDGITSYDESALRVLSRFGRFDAVQLLLHAGAGETQLAWTPLHRAVALGTLEDVKTLVAGGAALEELDWCGRTPWLVAVKTGDLITAQFLLNSGADFLAGKKGRSPLNLASESFHTPMLQWLLELGISVEATTDCCRTPLMVAVGAKNAAAVELLIAAGADIRRQTACGNALRNVDNRKVALKFVAAGVDPSEFSLRGQRALLGLSPDADELMFEATHEDYRLAPTARWGKSNPERMDQPFWQAMIRSGIDPASGAALASGSRDDGPTWCACRFGQSLTLLPDGRAIQIGGEHEDPYDYDFRVHNDVFVHHRDGRIEIFCYPKEAFPPTGLHTATLFGDLIYIIGGLGYRGSRRFGETPVYRLNTHTLRIDRVETTGQPPGWIFRHRATLSGTHEIRVWSGKVAIMPAGIETSPDNPLAGVFDVSRGVWRCENL